MLMTSTSRESETGNTQNSLGNTDINVMEDWLQEASPACDFIKDVSSPIIQITPQEHLLHKKGFFKGNFHSS